MDKITEVLKVNQFPLKTVPLIMVIRNYNFTTGVYIPNSGVNSCDTILCTELTNGKAGIVKVLQGRTFPHITYIKKMLNGELNCNYIASQYLTEAFKRGLHKGEKAGVQNKKFIIMRTKDEILMDEDDFPEVDIVADNIHGNAPYSAGCITINGKMKNGERTGDWLQFYNWMYKDIFPSIPDCVILNFEDWKNPEERLRFGSTGDRVKKLQEHFPELAVDGDFGFNTFYAVSKFQKLHGIYPSGIIDSVTKDILKFI
jgi:hypothetical protein